MTAFNGNSLKVFVEVKREVSLVGLYKEKPFFQLANVPFDVERRNVLHFLSVVFGQVPQAE